MKPTEHQKRLDAVRAEQELIRMKRDFERSRSITVGTAFGGTTEISMSGDSGHLWCIMQPVEVIELIHQLAANVGCHIHLQPREDFSSWRNWRVTEDEKLHLQGHPPFPSDMVLAHAKGASLPAPEQPPSVTAEPLKEQEHVVATKKTVNRRSTKPASKTP